MRFRCKECGALHEIPDERLGKGKRVRCQRCRAITVVRPGEDPSDPPTKPSAKVPDLDEPADAEPDMEAPTRIASIEDVLAAEGDAGADAAMDASTRVATRDELAAAGGRPAPMEDELDATTRVASSDELMSAGAGPLPKVGHDDEEDDGIVAYDAVDWETRPTVETDTVEAVPVQPLAAEVSDAVPVQPLAAEVSDDGETITTPGGAPRPLPADPSLSETLFSDSVMDELPDDRRRTGEFSVPATVTTGPGPAPAKTPPASGGVVAFSGGAASSGGHKLLWFLVIVVVLGLAAFGAMMVFPELGFIPGSEHGGAVTAPAKLEAPKPKPKPKPRSVMPEDAIPSEPMRLPGQADASADKQAAGFLQLAEQAEERGEVLEARLLAAASLAHRDAEEARTVLARLDDAPRPQLAWRSHPGALCSSLAYAPDGKRLACAASDAVLLWDLESGREIGRLVAGGAVRVVAISPDGRQLAAGGSDRAVWLWNLDDLAKDPVRLSGHGQPVTALAYSADGARLASGSEDRTVRLWNVEAGKAAGRLSGHRKAVSALAFSADGQRLYSASHDRTIREWDAAAAKKLRVLEGHAQPVLSLALSASGLLASGAEGGVVRLWRTDDEADPGKALDAHQGAVRGLAFVDEGSTLASAGADGSLRLWQTSSGEAGKSFGHDGAILALAGAPDGRRIAAASDDGTLQIWAPDQGKAVARLSGAIAPLTAVDISPDDRLVAVTDESGAVRVFTVQNGLERALRPRPEARTARSLRFSPDGARLAVAFGTLAQVFEYPEMKSVNEFEAPTDVVAFTPDGTKLATGGAEPPVVIWDTQGGDELLRLDGPERGITSLLYGPGGRFLVAGSRDGTARIWYLDTDDSEVRRGSARDPVTSLAFFARAGQVVFGTERAGIRRWVLARAVEEKPLKVGSAVRALAASPDGRRFASGSEDGRVILWDVKSGEALVGLTAHRAAVTGIDFSGDGSLLAACSADGTLRLWRFPDAAERSGKRRSGAELLAEERSGSRLILSGDQLAPDPSLFGTAFSVDR